MEDLPFVLQKDLKKPAKIAIICRVARFFLVQYLYQNGKKYTKYRENISNGHKIYQMAVKYTKSPQNIPTSSIGRPSKIYPNWDFLV
jgi:hypothetical protein